MTYERIDVHSHFLPPFYTEELIKNGYSHPDGIPAIPPWDVESHLSLMSTLNISKSILSISSPGVSLTAQSPELAATLARRCNAFAADLKRQHPDKFGFWAILPLPDVSAAVAEISAASDDDADGFILLTNAQGQYLGDAALAPVFAALNARHATVFLHPTTPCMACPNATATSPDAGSIGCPAAPLSQVYTNAMFEFFFDTARAVTHLFLSGTVAAHPDVTFIVPHAGGALPPLLNRVVAIARIVSGPAAVDEAAVLAALRSRFYFDLAGFVWGGEGGGEAGGEGEGEGGNGTTNQLEGLVRGCGVGSERLLYGTDFPFSSAARVQWLAGLMERGLDRMFGEDEVRDILVGNAKKLLEKTKKDR